MAENTKIEWAHHTFNPWTGCTKIGPGCDHCYAEGWAKRSGIVQWGPGAERRRTSDTNWKQPLKWNAEAERLGIRYRVFCASLADVADKDVPMEWRRDLFERIRVTPYLDWLLVTKRIGNFMRQAEEVIQHIEAMPDWNEDNPHPFEALRNWLADWVVLSKPPANLWLGITVVNQAEADRDIPKLLGLKVSVRFLSMEPLLGPVDLRFHIFSEPTGNFRTHAGKRQMELRKPVDGGLHWVIVGGESGPGARPMHPKWARDLRDQCAQAGVPFLFKQHGEWLATDFCDDDTAMIPSKRTAYVRMDGSFHDGSDGVDFFGGDEETAWVGKKAAGRLLDGIEHNGYPASRDEEVPA